MMTKKFFLNIHLYLSLIAGIVITILCLTGSILVFEDELKMLFHSERYLVKPGKERLSLDILADNLKHVEQKAKIKGFKVYQEPNRSVEITFKGGKEDLAFLNPYTGKVIDVFAAKKDFFARTETLHRTLFANKLGKFITGTSTFIFVFILITGIILWWPKSLITFKQRTTYKNDVTAKRRNYDLHVVTGFYASLFLFVMAFTGLAWSFKWFNNGIYAVTNSSPKSPEPPKTQWKVGEGTASLQQFYDVASADVKNAVYYKFSLPEKDAGVMSLMALPKNAIHASATDMYYYDPILYTKLDSLKFEDRNLGQQVRRSFYPIHTGSIFGWTSKIIAFLACIVGVTLPITGTIMWVSKWKKKKPNHSTGFVKVKKSFIKRAFFRDKNL